MSVQPILNHKKKKIVVVLTLLHQLSKRVMTIIKHKTQTIKKINESHTNAGINRRDFMLATPSRCANPIPLLVQLLLKEIHNFIPNLICIEHHTKVRSIFDNDNFVLNTYKG